MAHLGAMMADFKVETFNDVLTQTGLINFLKIEKKLKITFCDKKVIFKYPAVRHGGSK